MESWFAKVITPALPIPFTGLFNYGKSWHCWFPSGGQLCPFRWDFWNLAHKSGKPHIKWIPSFPKVWLCNIKNNLPLYSWTIFRNCFAFSSFSSHSRKVRLMDRNQAAFIIDTSEPFHSSIHWIGRHKITSIFAHFLGQLHLSWNLKSVENDDRRSFILSWASYR